MEGYISVGGIGVIHVYLILICVASRVLFPKTQFEEYKHANLHESDVQHISQLSVAPSLIVPSLLTQHYRVALGVFSEMNV